MRDRKPKPQNTEFRFSKEVRGKAKINDNPIVADLDMLQKKHSNVLKTKGAVARLILAIKDDPTHFLDGSNPQNALLLKKLKDGKTGMIGVRREDTPENLIVHALKSSNKKEIERLVRRQMGRASLPTTLKNETGTGAKAHSSASGDIISQNSAKGGAAEQGSKLEQAETKQEVVKGEGWTMRDGGAAKTDYTIKTDLAPNVRDLSKTTVDEITADLEYLAAKHPEIFDKPSDVFKLIKEIKENPTHFFTNYRLDYALIVKRLEDNKIGKLAVDKQSGEVTHATKVRQRDLARMDRVSRQTVGTSTLPTPLSAADKNALKQDANSAGEAYSSATERIISQNSAKDEEAIKTYVNPHVGAGLAGGTLNSVDENGNFDAEKFAKGFIYGLFGSKVTAATLKKTNPKLYDQIVNIGKDKADKEKISSFVNKLKQDELGKLLQKTITNNDLSTKTKIEIIEAAKKRFTKGTPKSLSGQSEAQMGEKALKAKENSLKIDDVSNDAKEKWIETFGLKSIDDDFIPNLKPEVKKAIKDKEIRLTKGSLLKIVARGREKYIPLIKQSLEDTDMVLKDEGTFLFVKEMDDKSLVFTSVGRNFDTHITIISNAPKKINNIKNKLMNKAEIVYRSSKLRTTPL